MKKIFKNRKKKFGFTLIEMLVVIGILGFTMSALLYFLFSAIQSANQTSISAEAQQNGQAVLDAVSSQIRNGYDATIPSYCSGSVTYCIRITRKSDYLFIAYYTLGTSHLFETCSTTDTSACSSYSPLTNYKDLSTGVTIYPQQVSSTASCLSGTCKPVFSVFSTAGLPTVVSINFVVQQNNSCCTKRVDQTASVPFSTVITLRSY